MKTWIVAALSVPAGSLLVGCPAGYESMCDNNACVAPDGSDARGGEGGIDARADAGHHDGSSHDGGVHDAPTDRHSPEAGMGDVTGDTFTCDGSQPPSTAACVISEEYGVFVAPAANGGSDVTGTGTRSQPYASITNALKNLGSLTRVYVCNGSYTDQITVSGAVSIFGGLTCGSAVDAGTVGPWVYATGTKATVGGSSPAFTLEVNAGSSPVDVEDMEFDALAGTSTSTSSVAVFATSSSSVTMKRVTLTAADGFQGGSGTIGANGALLSTTVNGATLATPSPNGQPASGTTGGAATMCECVGGATTSGGSGGSDAAGEATGGNGLPTQTTPTPPGATGAGGTEATCSAASSVGGIAGSDAVPAAASDGPGATAGVLDVAGWHPGAGTVGFTGAPGQGGGGGGAVAGGGGGGGGCGGCGGSGGGFGSGGGASVALLAYDSPVQLFSSTLATAAAGPGGAGAGGGVPQTGGPKGVESGGACNGGNGGTGSAGGAGGGGAGGVSIGILYMGNAPVPDTTTQGQISTGTKGAAGPGGDLLTPNNGAIGVSAAIQDVSGL